MLDMLGGKVSQPRYWKALAVTLVLFGPPILVFEGVCNLSLLVSTLILVIALPAIAALIHLRARNDFLAAGTMQAGMELRHTAPRLRK